MIAPVTHTIAAHSESDIDRQWFRGIAPAIEGWTGLYGGSDDGRSVGRLERHLPVFDLKRPEGLCPQSFIGLSATSRTGSLRGWNVIGRSAARSGLASAQRQNGKQGTRDLHTVPFSIGYPQQAMNGNTGLRSEEHTSELQSLMRLSSAVFCMK